jgi:hypothetical protein
MKFVNALLASALLATGDRSGPDGHRHPFLA